MGRISWVSGRIAHASLLALVALAGIGLQTGAADAAGCSARPAVHLASNATEVARLRRQIAANRAFEVKYACSAGNASGACREIFGRIAVASSRLAALSGVEPQASCRQPPARTIAVRGVPVERSAIRTAAVRLPPRQNARIETMCVRLSDGYFFPTPNSGYHAVGDREKIAVQCRFICDDPAMDVYRIAGADRNPDDMVSMTSGRRYSDLPAAGAYRAALPARVCDMTRFYKTAMARTPSENALGASAAILSSTQDAGPSRVTLKARTALLGGVGLRGSKSLAADLPRKIRIVGAAYLPGENGAFRP